MPVDLKLFNILKLQKNLRLSSFWIPFLGHNLSACIMKFLLRTFTFLKDNRCTIWDKAGKMEINDVKKVLGSFCECK
jgi:hypothetical protein